MKIPELIFWFSGEPDVMADFLGYVAGKWKNKVFVISLCPLMTEREAIYFDQKNKNYISIFRGSETDLYKFADEIINNHKDAIHIFGGFLGLVGICIGEYVRITGASKAVVISEKPCQVPVKHFNKIILFLKKIKSYYVYSKAYSKYKANISAVLPTGIKGMRAFHKYGVENDKMFNFIYTHCGAPSNNYPKRNDNRIKFLYVGRFNYLTRGMDTLLNAFSKLPGGGWSLDIVGGYGEDNYDIISRAQHIPNINYIGKWNADDVISNMQEYDICVSPTRMDGWRVQVNQAITAGIGTITTTEAVSDELIDASGAGAVVHPGKTKELYRQLRRIIQEPDIIRNWKVKAKKYAPRISIENVGNYFIEIINCIFLNDGTQKRPDCPWIGDKA